jgi:transcriptional repressor NF-X1
MANVEVSDSRLSDPPRNRGQQRSRGGRPSRGRGNRQRNSQPTETSSEPQGTAAVASVPAVDQSTTPMARDGSAPRGRGRGRGGARGSRRGQGTTTGSGQRTAFAASRAFGGHLTTEMETEDQTSEASGGLNADAPVFVPGQPLASAR